MAKNIKKEALAATNALNTFNLEEIGVKLGNMSAKTARTSLARVGVNADALSDKAAILVQSATVDLDKVSNAAKSAALKMGVLSDAEYWKAALAPDGKSYKSENAFLRDYFPGYAVSTTSLYADVGKSIYIPILQKRPGYEGLDFLVDMSPSNAKFLLATVKDDEKRALLPSAYAEIAKTGKLNQRAIAQMAKNIKEQVEDDDSSSDANPDGAAMPKTEEEAADIQAQLQGTLPSDIRNVGNTTESKVRYYFQCALNEDSNLAAMIDAENLSAFIGLLTKGAGDANVAMTICSEMGKIIAAAMSNK